MIRKVFLLAITFQIINARPTIKYGYVPNTPENSKIFINSNRLPKINFLTPSVALLNSGNFKQNAEELSGQFEGDMILNYEQAKMISLKQRTGLINEKYRWQNKTIPYTLTDKFSTEQKEYIRSGLDRLEEVSCLKFVPKTSEIDFVNVTVRSNEV